MKDPKQFVSDLVFWDVVISKKVNHFVVPSLGYEKGKSFKNADNSQSNVDCEILVNSESYDAIVSIPLI